MNQGLHLIMANGVPLLGNFLGVIPRNTLQKCQFLPRRVKKMLVRFHLYNQFAISVKFSSFSVVHLDHRTKLIN